MSGACASAMATSAHTMTSANNKTVPMNFRRRIDMTAVLPEAAPVAGAGASTIWSARPKQAIGQKLKMTAVPFDEAHARAIRLWLYAVAALVLAMVLVGGATRLTESGLSITEWRPGLGALPPLGEGQWQSEFEKYQAVPQYRALNQGMSLEAFKTIYWWEWAHRLIGRVIGVAFLLPFLWFLWRGWVGPRLRGRLWFIFGLGALQGAVGWWVVASGTADRIEVSQYRLATHLVLACVIYVALI